MLKNSKYVYGPSDLYVPANLNFGELILGQMMKYKNKVALINADTNVSTTYGEIVQCAVNLSINLYSVGVRRGVTVAICSENRDEFWSSFVGVICTGATLTTVNVGYTAGELEHVFHISKPTYVLCSPQAYDKYKRLFAKYGKLKTVILFGDNRVKGTVLYKDLIKVGKGLSDSIDNINPDNFTPADVNGQNDTMLVLYSSGTTGLPKGVMLSHHAVLTMQAIYSQNPGEEDLTSLNVVPWFHAMGLIGLMLGLCAGRTIVYIPKFKVDTYLKCVEKYKINQISVPPPVLIELCKSPTTCDSSSLVAVYCGAAPLYSDTYEAVKKRFGNAPVYQAYGMTETCFAVTRDSPEFGAPKPGSVGKVVPNVVIKIVDVETRQPLAPNQKGEICVKGPMLMKGYIGKDRSEDFDSEGFLKTGDIGYYDRDGYFFIVDRLKELIKYKGYQVAPAEIEAVLLKHEAVKDAAVTAMPDESAGEVPIAFVVVQPGKEISEDEIKLYVANELSNPKHLRGGVRFMDSIPRNPSGKILRRELKTMALESKKGGKSKL